MPDQITADDIKLRSFEKSDAARFASLFGNSAVCRYLSPHHPRPYTEAHALDFITRCLSGERIERVITTNGELVGGIGCSYPSSKTPAYSLGYWLSHTHWHRGIMTQALQLFLNELSAQVPNGSLVEAQVFAANLYSRRLLLRAGFQQKTGFGLMLMRDGLQHPTYTFARTVPSHPASSTPISCALPIT